MFLGSTRARVSILGIALAAASPAVAAIDLVGVPNATFLWQPASGPVSGYVVYQLCTDGRTHESSVVANRVTLAGEPCNSFRVQVAALSNDGSHRIGPLSDPSESVRFLPAPPIPPVLPAPPAPPMPPAPPPTPDPGSAGDPHPADPGGAGLPPAAHLDFDADGRSELLLHHAAQGRLERASIRPQGPAVREALPRISTSARIVGNGDYDGDGHADLLAVDAGQAFLWLLHGATPIGGGPVGEEIGPDASIEGSGDYDGDGVSDVLVRRPALGRVEIWSMEGGQIAAVDTLAADPGADWQVIGSGDHDADGISDVLWRNAAEGMLVQWRMRARGQFESVPLAPRLGAAWEGVAVGDIDGNDCADVVWRNAANGDLAATLFDAGVPTATVRIGPQVPLLRREIVGSGDYDGDGHMDLLVRLRRSRYLTVWTLDGAHVMARRRVAALAPGWRPAGVGDESPGAHRWEP